MTRVLVHDLDEKTVRRLEARARARGRSLEAEVRRILDEAAREPIEVEPSLRAEHRLLAERMRASLGGGSHTDSAEILREDRNR